MQTNEISRIIQALDGLSYAEWKKLKMCIDEFYLREASKQNNKIRLADDGSIVEAMKHYSSTI